MWGRRKNQGSSTHRMVFILRDEVDRKNMADRLRRK